MNYSILSINYGIVPNDLLEYKPSFYVQLKHGMAAKYFRIGDTIRVFTPGTSLFNGNRFTIKDILSDLIVFNERSPSMKAFGISLIDSYICHC
jgi:hypothetical protein